MNSLNANQQKQVDAAAAVIAPGENVIDATSGLAQVMRMGTNTQRRAGLIVTDRRIIIFSKKLGGYDMSDYAYGLLTSIEYKRGMMFGEITIKASGDHTKFSQVPKDEVERAAQAIRAQMAGTQTHGGGPAMPLPPPPPSAPVAVPIIEQIRQLGELRDAGVLTPDEFDRKKAELLSRL